MYEDLGTPGCIWYQYCFADGSLNSVSNRSARRETDRSGGETLQRQNASGQVMYDGHSHPKQKEVGRHSYILSSLLEEGKRFAVA